MRFDAYAGNIRNLPPAQVAEVLGFACKGTVARGKPRGRYSDVWELDRLPDEGSVWVGLDRSLEAAYFEAKGSITPAAVHALRRHWQDAHTVSRLDSCEDYNDPAAYAQLLKLFDAACDPRVKSHAWQPRGPSAAEDGASTYWGSTKSRVMVRVYEAGKKKERLHYMRPDWVRAEAQVRPGKGAEKVAAAQVSALDAWGFAAWTQRAAVQLSQVEVNRFAPDARPPDHDRTTLYLARAFRNHWQLMKDDGRDWPAIGKELESVWAADDHAAAAFARWRKEGIPGATR
jgi:hypothetical protein